MNNYIYKVIFVTFKFLYIITRTKVMHNELIFSNNEQLISTTDKMDCRQIMKV